MPRPNKRRAFLRIEALEERTVPTGLLAANAFHDANENGVRDALEGGG